MDTNPKMETNLKQSLFSDDQKIFSQDDLKSRSISLDHRKTVRESDVNSETDGYFWSEFESFWTRLDQKKLISLDYLIHRALEFHNNHHTFQTTRKVDYDEFDENYDDDIILDSFISTTAKPFNGTQEIALRHLGHHLSHPYTEEKLVWFHLRDLRALPAICDRFKINPINVSGFNDLRVHSSFMAFTNATFVSFCSLTYAGDDAKAFKVYCYASSNLLLTYEREIVAEYDIGVISGQEASVKTEKDSEDKLLKGLSITDILKNRMRHGLCETAVRLGPLYIIYELGMESLGYSDNIIEFISRTIFYLKQQVHGEVSYAMKLIIYRQIHILFAAIMFFEQMTTEISENIRALTDKTSAQFVVTSATMTWEHLMFFCDMEDCYRYKTSCLMRQQYDISFLERAMGHVTTVRNEKTSVNLSLIATVFMPITFLAGVFGMNFQTDGGYTIELLNKRRGPEVFVVLCGVVIVINVYFFIRSGYLSWRPLYYFDMYMMQFGFKKNRRVPLATVSDNNVSNPLSPPQFTSRLDDESREEEQRRMSTQLARRLNSAQNRSSRLSLSRASRTYAGSKGNSFSMRESAATSARGSSRGGDVTKNA